MIASRFSEECTSRAKASVSIWLASIADALEVGTKVEFPPAERLPRPVPTFDSRSIALVKDALLRLPGPLRALLSALADVKQEKTRLHCAHLSAVEATLRADLLSRVQYVYEIVKSLSAASSAAEEPILLDSDLQNEITRVAGACTEAALLKALNSSLGVLNKSRELASQAPVVFRKPPVSNAIERAQAALEHSIASRTRLKALLRGTSLPGPVPVLRVVDDPPEVSMPPITVQEPLNVDYGDLDHIKMLLRRFRRAAAAARNEHAQLIDDEVRACVAAVRAANLRSTKEPMVTFETSSLDRTDTELQKEIGFVCNSLTVDIPSLDAVLRSIRQSCNGIEEEAALESTAAWTLDLNAWHKKLSS